MERLDHDARAPDIDGDEHQIPADELRDGVPDADRIRRDERAPSRVGQPHPVEGEPAEQAVRGEGARGELPLEEGLRAGKRRTEEEGVAGPRPGEEEEEGARSEEEGEGERSGHAEAAAGDPHR